MANKNLIIGLAAVALIGTTIGTNHLRQAAYYTKGLADGQAQERAKKSLTINEAYTNSPTSTATDFALDRFTIADGKAYGTLESGDEIYLGNTNSDLTVSRTLATCSFPLYRVEVGSDKTNKTLYLPQRREELK